jgi:hypothetical protein
LKRAKELVSEIGLAVQPPRGVPIVLIEDPDSQPNWVAAAGPMESALTHKFGRKVIELRESNPLIDWRGVNYTGDTEARRVVKFVSATAD